MLERLHAAGEINWFRASLDSASVPANKGAAAGPNPTDQGKPGTKRTSSLTPAARRWARLTGANRHDSLGMAPTLNSIVLLGTGRRGRPRCRPYKLHTDKAYEAKTRLQEWRARGIVPRIAREGIERSEGLGRYPLGG